MTEDSGHRGRALLVGFGCLGLLVAVVALGLASVSLAALATGTTAPHGWDQLGEAFSVINGVFSVLAFAVVATTLWVQFTELRMQRVELRMQREATERSQQDLHRSAEADIRGLHLHLVELAIADPDLAVVWPEFAPNLPPQRRKQFLYANLILSHLNMARRVVERGDTYLPGVLADVFTSPIMQEFWSAVREYRQQLRTEGPDMTFDDMCEAAYQAATTQDSGMSDLA